MWRLAIAHRSGSGPSPICINGLRVPWWAGRLPPLIFPPPATPGLSGGPHIWRSLQAASADSSAACHGCAALAAAATMKPRTSQVPLPSHTIPWYDCLIHIDCAWQLATGPGPIRCHNSLPAALVASQVPDKASAGGERGPSSHFGREGVPANVVVSRHVGRLVRLCPLLSERR